MITTIDSQENLPIADVLDIADVNAAGVNLSFGTEKTFTDPKGESHVGKLTNLIGGSLSRGSDRYDFEEAVS